MFFEEWFLKELSRDWIGRRWVIDAAKTDSSCIWQSLKRCFLNCTISSGEWKGGGGLFGDCCLFKLRAPRLCRKEFGLFAVVVRGFRWSIGGKREGSDFTKTSLLRWKFTLSGILTLLTLKEAFSGEFYGRGDTERYNERAQGKIIKKREKIVIESED